MKTKTKKEKPYLKSKCLAAAFIIIGFLSFWGGIFCVVIVSNLSFPVKMLLFGLALLSFGAIIAFVVGQMENYDEEKK